MDENWNAYPDQWKTLLSKPKLSKEFIEDKLKEWKLFAANRAIEIDEILEQDGEKPWDKIRENEDRDALIISDVIRCITEGRTPVILSR